MQRKLKFALSALFLVVVLASGTELMAQGEGWHSLQQVTHHRILFFKERGRPDCVWGTISRITADSLVIDDARQTAKIEIKKTDLLRVFDGSSPETIAFVTLALYSGRSSWRDVMWLPLIFGKQVETLTSDGQRYNGVVMEVGPRQINLMNDKSKTSIEYPHLTSLKGAPIEDRESRVRVTKKNGKSQVGWIAEISQAGLVLSVDGKPSAISKSDVQRVELLQDRPASDRLDFWAKEMGYVALVDPETWVYLAMKPLKLAVPLFEADLPEENDPIECK